MWWAAHCPLNPLFPLFVGITTAKVKEYISQLPLQQVWPCMTTFLLTGEWKGCVRLPCHLIKMDCFLCISSLSFHGWNRHRGHPASAMKIRTTLWELRNKMKGTWVPAPATHHVQLCQRETNIYLIEPLCSLSQQRK